VTAGRVQADLAVEIEARRRMSGRMRDDQPLAENQGGDEQELADAGCAQGRRL